MGTLGSKEYNYNFYGLPDSTRVWGTAGVGGYAALTYLNIWGEWFGPPISEFVTDGIYWSHDGTNSDNNGKKLDDSIGLWHIPNNSSFATNGIFTHDITDTLSAHFDTLTAPTNVSLIAGAIDSDSTIFGRRLENRYAYDESYPCNGSYSAPVFDIVPYNFCLRGFVIPFNRTSGTIMSGVNLSSVKNTIDNANDDIDICVIRPSVYRAATTPRFNGREYIPPQGQHTTYQGTILFDTLTDHIIPDSQFYLQELIDDNKVFAPWYYQYAQMLYNGNGSNSYDAQMDIGFSRPLTVSQLKNGAYSIDSGHKITAQLFRCNDNIKTFDDVVYKWDYVCFDVTNKIDLQNGFPLTSLNDSDSIRFYTKLSIIDYKGQTRGEALTRAIKHELAYVGLYFADNQILAANAELGVSAEGVYLPLFSGGVTTGEYVTGDEIPLQAHARSESVSDDTYKYVPNTGEGDTGDLTTRFIQTEMKDSTRMFGMTASEFSTLTHWLNTGVIPEIQTDTDFMQKFKNVNPADYVLSMRYYPFDLPVGYGIEVYVGPVQVLANNQPFTVTHIPRRIGPKKAADLGGQSLFDFGTVNVPIDNDFRINYTKMLLYVPWCGYAELDPKIFAYSQGGAPTHLNVKLSIDYGTGSCMGIITRVNSNGDQTVIQTVNGSCGVDVPLFAVNHGEYAKTIKDLEVALQQAETARFTAGVGLVGSMIGTAAAAYSGNALGAFAGIGSMIGTAAGIENTNTKLDSIKYQIEHYAPSVSNISGASPFNNILFEAIPKLYIYKPIMLPGYNASVYGHTVGFACNRSGKLSDFSGLTVCASYDLSGIECTADEKQIISNYLKGGVIV